MGEERGEPGARPAVSVTAFRRLGGLLHLDAGAQIRLLSTLLLALALAAVDQSVKVAITTPDWAYHHRSGGWFLGSCLLFVGAAALARVPSRGVVVGAAVFAGGLLGNLLSASSDHLYVANPLLIGNNVGVAFNLADVFILVGNATLVVSLIMFVIGHRHRIEAWNAALSRSLRHHSS